MAVEAVDFEYTDSMNMEYPYLAEARYEDPKDRQGLVSNRVEGSKTLCVVSSFFPLDWKNVQYQSREQGTDEYIKYEHNRFECLKFVLACHRHYDAGHPYDLVIVNNGKLPRDIPVDEDQMLLLDHPLIVRENTFFSFGAYRCAVNLFPSYDYYVFQEMDWAPCHHGWLKQFMDIWESDPEIGMIGNLIERHSVKNADPIPEFMTLANPDRDLQYNLDSEYFFTSKTVLDSMPKWNLFRCSPETGLSPAVNELAFQQPILERGYKIRCFNDNKHTMFYCLYNRAIAPRWDRGLENLAPFVPEQTRLFCYGMQKHFEWY